MQKIENQLADKVFMGKISCEYEFCIGKVDHEDFASGKSFVSFYYLVILSTRI